MDEAGDPTLFHRWGKPIVGTDGCSRFFILGKLEVANPEVRYRDLNRLRAFGPALRFQGVVSDKQVLLRGETERRAQSPLHRYQPDGIYDGLVRSLFSRFHRVADAYEVCLARRGSRDRTQAIRQALEHAEADFVPKYGFSRGGKDAWRIRVSEPRETVCLQAVDTFLWALQRFYEVRPHPKTGEGVREERFLRMLWPQVGEIHDLDFGPEYGAFFTAQRPLTLEARFGETGGKRNRS